jgi:Flp pilus assembly pilin Flp
MLTYVGLLYDNLRWRLQRLRDEPMDRGASALEWAIIAAISVVMATFIGVVIYNIVQNKAKTINSCGNQPVGTSCAPGGG